MKAQTQAQFAALALALVASAAEVSADRTAFEPTTIKAPFLEQFTSDWSSRWAASAATKEQKEGEVFSYSGQWSVEEPTVFPGLAGDEGLVAKSKASQHAISAQFKEVVKPEEYAKAGKPFVVQYEAKFQKGLTCGGAYLKLLSESAEGIQAKEFSDKTPYTIMFGPDKCGTTNKVHFIFRHKNPKTGEVEEKHLVNPPYPKLAKTTNLYTLIVNPDNTYEILINNDSRKKGSLFEDFEPSVNPPAEIDDPTDKKPADWVDEQRILDPDAKKPDDWDESAPLEIPDETQTKPEGWLDDEPSLVPDPEAVKPEEWDDEEDGEWIAPQVPNPKCTAAPGCGEWVQPTKRNPDYKGKWLPGYIDNPAYKGEWKPKKIPNPDFVEDKHPNYFSPIGGIGFEIWTMDEDILFDNIYVGDSIEDAKKLSDETFAPKLSIEQGFEKEEEKEKEKIKEQAKKVITPSVVDQVREKLWIFGNELKIDPVAAVKENPDVAGALAATVLGFFGLIGILFGALGGGDKAAKASAKAKGKAKDLAKKVDEPAAKAKATAVEAKDAVKKRATAAVAKDDE